MFAQQLRIITTAAYIVVRTSTSSVA